MVWQQEHRLSYEDFLEKYQFIVYLFIIFFIILSLRLFHLQVIQGSRYHNISEQQRTQIILERAPRGIIYDANGKVLVGNKTSFVALFYPFTQSINPPRSALDRLSKILDDDKLIVRLVRGWRYGQAVRLAANLSRQDMFSLLEQRLMLPGISVVKEARREYANPEIDAHLIGYLNEITKRELETLNEEGYKSGDWVGRGGLEQFYDSMLRGKDGGWQIEVDAYGRQTRIVRHVPSTVGNSLYTTIDANLQKIAGEALESSPTKRGAIVAVDPRNGAVRVLVSSPGFDPNTSVTSEFGQYLNRKDLPLFNRSIQALYAPGSTFKIITLIAALADKKADPNLSYTCKGSFIYANKTFKCWEKKGHGRISLMDAFAKSCNVYFYQLGLKVGPEPLQRYAKEFRLGQLTGIEGTSEKAGLVPTEAWKKAKMHDRWHPGDTINMAIGQGPLWVSPVQMASLMSTVANRGKIYQLHMADKIVTQSGENIFKFSSKKIGSVSLTDDVWDKVHEAMKAVVNGGTGGACYFPDLTVGGKSGTAQNPQGKDHAWFVSFAPVEKPQLAVVVIVENGGSGGAVAAPIARKIYQAMFKKETAVVMPVNAERPINEME